MRRLKIVHRTRYEFPETVRLGPHRLLLRPREGHELHIESSLLETSPVATVHWLRDIYDNSVAIANFALPATVPQRIARFNAGMARFNARIARFNEGHLL